MRLKTSKRAKKSQHESSDFQELLKSSGFQELLESSGFPELQGLQEASGFSELHGLQESTDIFQCDDVNPDLFF